MSLQPPPPPPPRRSSPAASGSSTPANADGATTPGWKEKMKASGKVWGKKAMDKGVQISDSLGGRVNDIAEKRFGTEAFWPVTGDFPKEMDKCARILRAFTVDGIVTEEKEKIDPSEPEGKKKKKIKVIRKIPPAVIARASGLAIFTSMRTGFAPFGGAGGAGVVVAKLPDGTWSAPASISPNNLSAGFLIGVDVYDCVLIINTQKALESFKTHKATIGAELGVAAGPYGAGAAVEAGLEKAPLLSYVKSRGVYAGVEIVGQVFVERFEENGAMYHWPGVKAGDILNGKVKVPLEAANLQAALRDAESGRAQAEKGDSLDIIVQENATDLDLEEGEVLKLPPTPDQTDGHEHESDPETERVHRASYPGSHNPSPSGSPGQSRPQSTVGLGGRLIPPPLPLRNSQRPALQHHHSSVSNYSDALENNQEHAQGVVDSPTSIQHAPPAGSPPADLVAPTPTSSLPPPVASPSYTEEAPPPEYELPSYAEDFARAPASGPSPSVGPSFESAAGQHVELNANGYPVEKKSQSASVIPDDALGEDGQPMTETERREWDEFFASQGNTGELQAPGQAGHASVGSGNRELDGLAGRLEGQHIDEQGKGKGREGVI